MSGSKTPTIIAITALIIAVFAATPLSQAASRLVLPKNSVGASQLRKNAVGSKKIAKNAITSLKVKDGSLLAADFKAGQIQAGPQGPKGDAGVGGYEIVKSGTITLGPGETNGFDLMCPAGKRALAGGWDTQAGIFIRISKPIANNAGWEVVAQNDTPYSFPFTQYITCANVN